MGRLRDRLRETTIAWTLETTPGIYVAVTLICAFVFSSVAFSLAVFAYFGTVGGFDASMVCFLATLGPPFAIVVLWFAYRIRWFRVKFPLPP